MKTDGLETKRVLRKVLGRHVPKVMFERRKQGFTPPLRSWLTGPLREWAGDLMSGHTASHGNALDPKAARLTLQRLHAGNPKHHDFRLIALAAWCSVHR